MRLCGALQASALLVLVVCVQGLSLGGRRSFNYLRDRRRSAQTERRGCWARKVNPQRLACSICNGRRSLAACTLPPCSAPASRLSVRSSARGRPLALPRHGPLPLSAGHALRRNGLQHRSCRKWGWLGGGGRYSFLAALLGWLGVSECRPRPGRVGGLGTTCRNLTGPPATARPTAIPLTAIQNARSQDVYRHEIFGFQADCKDCRCLKQESFDDFAAIRAQKVRASLMLHHAQTPVLILSGLSPSFAVLVVVQMLWVIGSHHKTGSFLASNLWREMHQVVCSQPFSCNSSTTRSSSLHLS